MEIWIRLTDRLRNFSHYVDVIQKHENGVVLGEYKMMLSDIVKSLSNSSTDEVQHVTPFLPSNCIKLLSTIHGHEVFIELPKRKWQITYQGKTLTVGFPRLLLKYSLQQKNVRNLSIFALREKGSINGETELYAFPYSNVHHDSGDVCMGTNLFPEIDCLTQLERLHYLFFAAPFGTDYGAMSLGGRSVEGLFKKLEDKEFEDDLLVPLQKTFNQFFNLEN